MTIEAHNCQIPRRRTINKTIQRLDLLCGCVCTGCGVVCGVRLVPWFVVCPRCVVCVLCACWCVRVVCVLCACWCVRVVCVCVCVGVCVVWCVWLCVVWCLLWCGTLKTSVCAFNVSPCVRSKCPSCVPATCPQLKKHVGMLPVHTGTF